MKYDNDTCNMFVEDMKKAGRDVEHYHGRFMWEGPAVRLKNRSDFQEVCMETSVNLQTDELGLGLVVYPGKSGKLLDESY